MVGLVIDRERSLWWYSVLNIKCMNGWRHHGDRILVNKKTNLFCLSFARIALEFYFPSFSAYFLLFYCRFHFYCSSVTEISIIILLHVLQIIDVVKYLMKLIVIFHFYVENNDFQNKWQTNFTILIWKYLLFRNFFELKIKLTVIEERINFN